MGWAEQLCSALNYLHMQRPPIIFRDLKPSNVMVTRAGKVKLIDFGIARVFAPGRTRDTQILGTPGFAPPEQYGKAQTDARADVYALGCTLYQLLSNYDPATTPFALPPLNTRNPKVSPHIQLAIERATKLDRDQRFQSVAEFEQALLHPDGLYFRNGERARNLSELVALCQKLPQEGADALYSGRIEYWLRAWGNTSAANSAASAARTNTDQAAGLRAFLASAARRATASPNPAARIFQNIPRPTVAQGAARTATAPTGTITVQPKSLHMGRLTQGQRGVQTIVVGGLPNSTVQGTITPLAPWLSVDRTIIRGASTLVQVFAETSKLPSTGVHQSQLVIRSGSQQVYLPVSVEALPAPAGTSTIQSPKSTAAPVKATTAQPAPSAGQSARKTAGPAASQTSASAKGLSRNLSRNLSRSLRRIARRPQPSSPSPRARLHVARASPSLGAAAVGAGLLPLVAFQWILDPASAAQRIAMLHAYAPWWPHIPLVWPLLWLVFLASLALAVMGAVAGHGIGPLAWTVSWRVLRRADRAGSSAPARPDGALHPANDSGGDPRSCARRRGRGVRRGCAVWSRDTRLLRDALATRALRRHHHRHHRWRVGWRLPCGPDEHRRAHTAWLHRRGPPRRVARLTHQSGAVSASACAALLATPGARSLACLLRRLPSR